MYTVALSSTWFFCALAHANRRFPPSYLSFIIYSFFSLFGTLVPRPSNLCSIHLSVTHCGSLPWILAVVVENGYWRRTNRFFFNRICNLQNFQKIALVHMPNFRLKTKKSKNFFSSKLNSQPWLGSFSSRGYLHFSSGYKISTFLSSRFILWTKDTWKNNFFHKFVIGVSGLMLNTLVCIFSEFFMSTPRRKMTRRNRLRFTDRWKSWYFFLCFNEVSIFYIEMYSYFEYVMIYFNTPSWETCR